MILPPIHAQEHLLVPISVKYKKWLKDCSVNRWNSETLGLHEKKSGGFAPGNFIGMVWLDKDGKRAVFRADPKFKDMDYITMFIECAKHFKISEKLLKIWTTQEPIDTDKHDFSILVIIAYLHELNEFCRRHMRRHFIRERQNFTGTMKGKIIVSENLRRNIIHGRPDRIYCEYQSVSDNILENQILRTALERAARYFTEYSGNKKTLDILPQWIRASRATLHNISIKHVKHGDFISARKHGSFAHYKRPLALAKAVLQQLGPSSKTETPKTQTPPFALNSAELFERYAEIILSKRFSKLKAPNNIGGDDDGNFSIKVRPDFYVPDETKPQIIDAKYKEHHKIFPYNDGKNHNPGNSDMYQIIAYSRHKELLRRIGFGDTPTHIKLGIAYPIIGYKEIQERVESKSFLTDIMSYGIPCPAKKTTSADDN